MSLKNSDLEQLKESMNVNIYEAKVWTALLSRGISSAGELADISGVPRSRCYDVLESLEKKGFVFQKVGKPIKYIAVEPKEVLSTLKRQQELEKNRKMALFEQIKTTDVFGELKALYSTGIHYVNSDMISTAIIGKQNINQFLKEFFSSAKKSITIHTTKKGVKRKLKILKKSKKPQVNVTIHSDQAQSTPISSVTFKNQISPLRMVFVDNEEVLFFTSGHDVHSEAENAIWMKSKFAVDALKNFQNI